MPADIPYMPSVKNLKDILEKIKNAGTPPKFTTEFLQTHLGFTSSNDRPVIQVLKRLGFLTAESTPTPRYNDFREDGKSGRAMSAGLREGWGDIFLADQKAYERSATQLKELFKNVTGKGESVAEKMASTFKSLAELADWKTHEINDTMVEVESPHEQAVGEKVRSLALHHDVHIHLPATSDVAVYIAIFRALREELSD